ncbi:hypothetical protein RU07_22990 [Agrobacterium tumefaciens]|uniref:DUF736 domain-containing protein n=1 Tax=Agrobacterium tumefaciens TaxID=358 RepID=A0A0D0IY31_AGRTU|nr:hypothetical protein RU07_22990 [Agrobacterium tumefaciens]
MTTAKLTNFIQFDNDTLATAKGQGRISTLTADIEIHVVPITSTNLRAPSHRVFGKSPAGYELEVGAIWIGENQDGGTKFTLQIKQLKFNANLGRYAGQDDESLQAIIPWQDRD